MTIVENPSIVVEELVRQAEAARDEAEQLSETLGKYVETAKKAVSDAESRINKAATNAAASATNAANSATAAADALAAIPQVDSVGNMTLAGSISVNTNGTNGKLTLRTEGGVGYLEMDSGQLIIPARSIGITGQTLIQSLTVYQQAAFDGGVTMNQALSVTGAINANGGVNIPSTVDPMLTGAVSNSELINYMVDRLARTAPYVSKITGLDLERYYNESNSTASPILLPFAGEISLNDITWGANAEKKIIFSADGLINPPTQRGPFYYQNHVIVFTAPALLRMSYRTSPGAVCAIRVLNNLNGEAYYGVRLVNEDGNYYYELFYKAQGDEMETIVVHAAPPSGVNLYGGSYPPDAKLNALIVSVKGNYNDQTHTVVHFGSWRMDVPFAFFSNAALEMYAKNGSARIQYWGWPRSRSTTGLTSPCRKQDRNSTSLLLLVVPSRQKTDVRLMRLRNAGMKRSKETRKPSKRML